MMNQLNDTEIDLVSGGCDHSGKYSFSFVIDNAIHLGSAGAFFNMLLNGVTVASFGWGFVGGAAAGATYATLKLVAQALDGHYQAAEVVQP
jgi:hypothetical protein